MMAAGATTAAVLSVNCGSSSIKFALYPLLATQTPTQVQSASLSGVVEGLEPGGQPVIHVQEMRSDQAAQVVCLPDHADQNEDTFSLALQCLRDYLSGHSDGIRIVAVAHRIVHGGDRYTASVVLDETVLTYLHTLNHLAPLHQPHNLDGVVAFQRAYPDVPQIACFDTGFHATMPEVERMLALPQALRDSGIRRYGFHGLSYRYVSGQLLDHTSRASQRVIMAHLGNGASVCAMQNGLSQATSMGFSALDGLMMGTRSGAMDPGVLLHLLREGWDVLKLEQMLYKESGLLGVSGISADMRRLRASDTAQAQIAIDLFTHKVIRECGALTACLGGLDVVAFTGGIGEHDALLRQQVSDGLRYLGVRIDADKNHAARGDGMVPVHAPDSSIEIWVVPTDEGLIAATDAARLLSSFG